MSSPRIFFLFLFIAFFLISCSDNLDHTNAYDPEADPVRYQKRSVVTGHIVLEGESDYAGVTVLLQGKLDSKSVVTDREGKFKFTGVIPGNYSIIVSEKYFVRTVKKISVGIGTIQDTGEIFVRALKFLLTGKVVLQQSGGESSSPDGAIVILKRVSTSKSGFGKMSESFPAETSDFTVVKTVDEDGEFHFNNVYAGKYSLLIKKDGYLTRKIDNIVIADEKNGVKDVGNVVLFRVTGAFKIRGYVKGENGEPVPDYSFSSTREVKLELYGFNATAMTTGNYYDGDCHFTGWKIFKATEEWLLTEGSGMKTVCVNFRDQYGYETGVLKESIYLDQGKPEVIYLGIIDTGDVVRYGERLYFRGRGELPLNSVVSDNESGVKDFRIRVNGSVSRWMPYQQYYSVTLTSDGDYTLRISFRDYAGNETSAVLKFIKDTTPPEGSPAEVEDVKVDGKVNSPIVNLKFAGYSTDTARILISNFPAFGESYQISATTSTEWYLTSGDGVKEIFVKYVDYAGNESPVYLTVVTLDTTPPPVPDLYRVSFSNNQIKIGWSFPGSADLDHFELQRKIEGIDTFFVTVAELPAGVTTYTDVSILPGYPHLYRIRTIDNVGNVSEWSAPFNAGLPIDPVKRAYYVSAADGVHVVWDNPEGTSTLLGNYSYEDITGETYSDNVYNNSTEVNLKKFPWEVWNGSLELRNYNYLGDMIWNNSFDLPGVMRKEIEGLPAPAGKISMALDRNGWIHMVFQSSDSRLIYATNAGSEWRYQVVEADGSDGWDSDIAVDENGRPYISFVDMIPEGSGSTYTAYFRMAYYSGGNWEIETFDESKNVSLYTPFRTSIALDSHRTPYIAYYQLRNQYGSTVRRLRVSYRKYGGWVSETVPDSNDAGIFNSIAVDNAGRIKLAYYDNTNHELKYAEKNGSSWSITVVDNSSHDVGAYNSLALDGWGRPHIVYADSDTEVVKYAFKSNGTWHTRVISNENIIDCDVVAGADGEIIASFVGSGLKVAVETGDGWQVKSLRGDGHSVSINRDDHNRIFITAGNPSSDGERIYLYELPFDMQEIGHHESSWIGGIWFNIENSKFPGILVEENHGGYGSLTYYYLYKNFWYSTPVTDKDLSSGRAVASDDEGKVHFVYYDPDRGELIHKYFYPDTDVAFYGEVVNTGGDQVNYPSLFIDERRVIHLIYVDNYNQVKYMENNDGDWRGPIMLDGKEDVENSVPEIIGRGDRVLIFYSDFSEQRNKLLYYDVNEGRIHETPFPAVRNFDVTMDRDNHIYLIYKSGNNLFYATSRSGKWKSELISSDAYAGHGAITVDDSGKVHMVYSTYNSNRIVYATGKYGNWKKFHITETGGQYAGFFAIAVDGKNYVNTGIATGNGFYYLTPSVLLESTFTRMK